MTEAEKIAAGLSAKQLIARTAVFNDSVEVADAVHDLLADVSAYWSGEAYTHIIGLWEHAQALTAALSEREK